MLMIGMTFFGGFTSRKRIVLLLLIVVLFTGGTLISCSSSSNDENWPLPADQMNYTAMGERHTTTLKVAADDGQAGGTTESAFRALRRTNCKLGIERECPPVLKVLPFFL